jgi:hypothetical protein
VLTCLLMVSMIQPNLILCFDPHGGDAAKYGSCNTPSGSTSEASLASDPVNQTCHSCADVPNTMTDIGGKSSSSDPIGMISGTSYSAKVASLTRLLCTHSYTNFPGVAHRDNSRPESAHRDHSSHSTSRTTVLLI